ncbi:DUF4979 domain-containing protein [Saccharicrinis sp. FJH62]|uniref:DUF4979 domain-containing protein n=1 Tax=Saccharicrinis sp. FJH62 TaxID=3344657 RepID=UPI0035D4FC99
MKSIKQIIPIICLLVMPLTIMAQRTFVHPGLSHKKSDLERMRYMVEAGEEPYASSFSLLQADSKSSYNYEVKGNSSMTVVTQDGTNYSAFSSDVLAAYLNALMWGITGDTRHADKCVEIFNAWENLTRFTGGGTESLNTGRVIWKLLEAAEIIKSTYDGWAQEDIDKFKAMLVYPGYSTTEVPANLLDATFYWRMYMGDPGRHGNQDLFGWRGIMAMGVFMDNEIMYDRALRYLKGLPHREDDLPYQSGPPIITDTPDPTRANDYYDYFNFPADYSTDSTDYGYNGVLKYFIWENGQCQESSRDQDHAILGVGMVASLAEIAWNQGDDLWSLYNNRILKGYEFALRYNVSYKYTYDDQPEPWEPTAENGEFIQRRDRTGRWFSKKINPYTENIYRETVISRGKFKSDMRPIYELPLAHYNIREGLSLENLKWTKRAYDISVSEVGYEQNGWSLDHLGWGGLTVHRPDLCAGDPCKFENGNPVFKMNFMPDTVEAENFDYFAADGEGHTYHDVTGTNSGNAYRPGEAVDIEECSDGGYNITNLEDGEWISYTVYIPVSALYDINVRYSAANSNGNIRFEFGGVDKTGDVTIPFGGDNSTALTDWKNLNVASSIQLDAGVQNVRIYISGESNSYKLNNFWITINNLANPSLSLSAETSDAAVYLSWNIDDIVAKKASIYKNTSNDFASSSLLVENIGGKSYLDQDVTNQGSYYYWLVVVDINNMTYISDAAEIISHIGLIDDEFNDGLDGWVANTSGASAKAENGQLIMTLAKLDNGKYRGDMKRSQGAVFHTGNYPIFAFKMDAPEVVNIHFDTNEGSYGDGANKWTGKIGDDVYYYDLTEVGFRGVIPSTTTTKTFDMIQLKVADITSGETSYTCDWVKTFTSLDALKDFVGTTPLNGIKEQHVNIWGYNNKIYMRGLENSLVTIFNIEGCKVYSGFCNSGNQTVNVKKSGFYIVKIEAGFEEQVMKVVVQ